MNRFELMAAAEGLNDEDLGYLAEHIQHEVKQRASRRGRALKAGDKVRFNGLTRPLYLQGELGTVVRVTSASKCTVTLDNPQGRFGNAPIKVPFTLLDVVG